MTAMEAFHIDHEDMLLTTTNTVQSREVREYLGIVTSNVTLGRHVGKDFLAGLRDFFGGRSLSWERSLQNAQRESLSDLIDKATEIGADGILGIRIEDEAVGSGNMMNVKVTGTAVKLE